MRELTMDEMEVVSGGMTNTQCVAAAGLAGGIAGAAMAGSSTWGFGAMAGFEFGALVGGLLGGLVCPA